MVASQYDIFIVTILKNEKFGVSKSCVIIHNLHVEVFKCSSIKHTNGTCRAMVCYSGHALFSQPPWCFLDTINEASISGFIHMTPTVYP